MKTEARRTRIKRVIVAAGIAGAALIGPFAASPAVAFCAPDSGTGSGCGKCPDPITIKGKEIIRFYCLM